MDLMDADLWGNMVISTFKFPIYLTIIVISIIIGFIYIFFSLKKEKKWQSLLWLYFILCFYVTLLFGKIYTILIDGSLKNILKIGLTSYGGAFGLISSSLIFEKMLSLDKKLIKYSIISLSLIYGISKISRFLVGCCYGIPYNGLFSVTYINGLNIPLFPVQLLETIVFIIIFLFLNIFKNKKNITYISIITMAFFKFLLDFLRYEHYQKIITSNQITSLIIIILTLAYWFYKKNINQKMCKKKYKK